MFSGITNPIPYLVAAYAIGVTCLVGLWYWVSAHQRRLVLQLQILEQTSPETESKHDQTGVHL